MFANTDGGARIRHYYLVVENVVHEYSTYEASYHQQREAYYAGESGKALVVVQELKELVKTRDDEAVDYREMIRRINATLVDQERRTEELERRAEEKEKRAQEQEKWAQEQEKRAQEQEARAEAFRQQMIRDRDENERGADWALGEIHKRDEKLDLLDRTLKAQDRTLQAQAAEAKLAKAQMDDLAKQMRSIQSSRTNGSWRRK